MLERLRSSDEPQSAVELGVALGLHVNTVRAHLSILEEAELVSAETEHRGRAGRPRRLFTAVPADAEDEHALLAAALASSLEPLPDGDALAAAAGRSWGRVLIERLEPGRQPDEDVCIDRVAQLLRRRGFQPERSDADLVMHRCPFRELAERYPRVVCSLHAGLIGGALEELEAPVALEELQPWVSPSTCVARLVRRSTPAPAASAATAGS